MALQSRRFSFAGLNHGLALDSRTLPSSVIDIAGYSLCSKYAECTKKTNCGVLRKQCWRPAIHLGPRVWREVTLLALDAPDSSYQGPVREAKPGAE